MADARYHPGFWIQSYSGWISIFNRFRKPDSIAMRADRLLRGLESAPGPGRDVAVLQATRDYEVVFDEENAIDERVRAVQLRFLALTSEYRAAEEAVDLRFQRAPIAKLFTAIVLQAQLDRAGRIEMRLPSGAEERFTVKYLIDGEWASAMECPVSLFAPLRGMAFLVRDAYASGLRERLDPTDTLPKSLSVDLRDEQFISIAIAD